MRDVLKLVLWIPAYAVARAAVLLYVGARLVLGMAPFLALAALVSEAPGLSREARDGVAIVSGFAGLGFLVWLMAARPPRAGASPSLRYRYAQLVGVGRTPA